MPNNGERQIWWDRVTHRSFFLVSQPLHETLQSLPVQIQVLWAIPDDPSARLDLSVEPAETNFVLGGGRMWRLPPPYLLRSFQSTHVLQCVYLWDKHHCVVPCVRPDVGDDARIHVDRD